MPQPSRRTRVENREKPCTLHPAPRGPMGAGLQKRNADCSRIPGTAETCVSTFHAQGMKPPALTRPTSKQFTKPNGVGNTVLQQRTATVTVDTITASFVKLFWHSA